MKRSKMVSFVCQSAKYSGETISHQRVGLMEAIPYSRPGCMSAKSVNPFDNVRGPGEKRIAQGIQK